MKKIPMPVVITMTILAVLIAGVMVYRTTQNPAGDAGDVKDLAKQVVNASPKNAPDLPPGSDPTKGAVSMGAKMKH